MAGDDDMRETLLGLFLEVAIVEHLARTHVERNYATNVGVAGFGVLSYFIRNRPTPDTIGGIAWAFQEDADYTASKVTKLEEAGYLTVTPPGSAAADATVFITDAGRKAHADQFARMAPDIFGLVAEIPPEDLRTTFRTLREMRLTLDNLPDR